jgi:23S rRNA U2552 (ribose-2'-O)-methylase RlmE/FtsJ
MSLSADRYDTDKGPRYLSYYEKFFHPRKDKPVKLLELGVHNGGSLQMWRDYFVNGTIFGVDISPPSLPDYTRIHLFSGDACEQQVFDLIAERTKTTIWDIIIDDASHMGGSSIKTFDMLFRDHLSPGGLYVLEDWLFSRLA